MDRTIPKFFRCLAVLCTAMVLMGCALNLYRAEPAALELLAAPGVSQEGRLTILTPESPADTGLVFYPGAGVEAEAYLPLLHRLQEEGVLCVLAEMPLSLALLDGDAAEEIIARRPEVEHWYIGGHSLGGVMASQFAAKHPDEVEGAVLLAAYVYGGLEPKDALTVCGSLDPLVLPSIGYTENLYLIEGGNHAQFGSYGAQLGDGEAAIPADQQQTEAAGAILEFMAQRREGVSGRCCF